MRGTIRSRACGARSLESLHALRGRAAGLVDDDDPDGDRPGQRTATDLVHAREHPVAVALERTLDAQARRARTRGRHEPGSPQRDAGEGLGVVGQPAGPVQGPHDGDGPAGDVVDRHGAVAAVPDGSWKRESSESERWSPMTHTCPSGTVTSKVSELGTSPGLRYGSLIDTPLTGEPALLVAAHDVVARQADDPLDEVVLGLGGEQADEDEPVVQGPRHPAALDRGNGRRASRPGPGRRRRRRA